MIEGVLLLLRTVIAPQRAQNMRRQRGLRINPQRLDFEFEPGKHARTLRKTRHLRGVQVLQNRDRQGAHLVVVALEQALVNHARLLQPFSDLRGDVAHHLIAGGPFQPLALRPRKPGVRWTNPLILGLKVPAQLGEIQFHVVGRAVLGQRLAVPIQDLAAHRRDAHGADGLILQAFGKALRGENLHIPKPRQQNAEPARQRHRHEAELGVLLSKLVENEHESGGKHRLQIRVRLICRVSRKCDSGRAW
jgi:hypothetical protein